MSKNSRLSVWLPVIIAASIALGIFIGNHYLSISQGKRRSYLSGNKINSILDLIDAQYVDTVNMRDLVESTIPKIFSELDPHSVYIPAEEAAAEASAGEAPAEGDEAGAVIALPNPAKWGRAERTIRISAAELRAHRGKPFRRKRMGLWGWVALVGTAVLALALAVMAAMVLL